MSQFIHIVDELLPPLHWIDERTFYIRPGKSLYAAPVDPMMLLLLDADHELTLADKPPVRIRTGDVCVFPPLIPRVYRSVRPNRPSRVHMLRLLFTKPPFLAPDAPAVRRNDGTSTFLNFLQEYLGSFRHLVGAITPRVHERIIEFRREIEARPPGYQVRISAMWLEFIVECVRACGRQSANPETETTTSSSRSELLIRRIKTFIVENHASPLTLEEIAWQAKLSREHVARVFRKLTGHTVFEYLTLVRIEVAQQLLADSALPINEIAVRVGFSSPTLFGRTFRRLIGVPPQIYRQQVLARMKFTPSILV